MNELKGGGGESKGERREAGEEDEKERRDRTSLKPGGPGAVERKKGS